MKQIAEKNGLKIFEDDETDAQKRFYVVCHDERAAQVLSVGPDNPKPSGRWFGRFTPAGIRYAANPRTKSAAMSMMRRHA